MVVVVSPASPARHAAISAGCLYVQPPHVDYLQALGFPAAKAAPGVLQIPAQSDATQRSRSARLQPPIPRKKYSEKKRKKGKRLALFGCLLAHWLARVNAALRDSAEAARGVDPPRTGRKTDDKRNVAQSIQLIQKYKYVCIY